MLVYSSFILLSAIVLSGTQTHDKFKCASERTKKLCIKQEVVGLQGEDVILPCWFNHSKGNYIKILSLILYRDHDDKLNVVIYNSSTNVIHESFKGRIQTLGNPSNGDGSVRIKDVKMEDEGMYRCGFRFREKSCWFIDGNMMWLSKHIIFQANNTMRTELRVEVRPKILRVWKEFMKSSNSWRLFCKAEAKPGPNITWWNPKGLLVHLSEIPVSSNEQNELQKIIGSYNLTEEEPAGNYSCLVENQHGMAQEHVMFKGSVNHVPGIPMAVVGWSIVLSLALIFALFLGFCIYRKKLEGNVRDTGLPTNPYYNEEEEEEVDNVYPARRGGG